ncbi:hypothetical protein Acr_09g0002330 [Actinidia rufa]|uniref:Uncharacterized protein n=1 Tax=Actinidia rufa TaxID=165716 RepID=A0A7J0F791_9ERIC|nr:hypothetical protein Acr_09g0002330 [Actinidia rufa]
MSGTSGGRGTKLGRLWATPSKGQVTNGEDCIDGTIREEGDLRVKLAATTAAVARSILPVRLEARTSRSVQMEQLLMRYQTPFTPEIEGMKPKEKFNLQNSVCPSNLGDLGLKWFNKLLLGSIGSFRVFSSCPSHSWLDSSSAPQAPKHVSSLFILRKRKNETLHNYSRRYWEMYNKIEGGLEEFTVVSYNLRLTPLRNLGMTSCLTSQLPPRPHVLGGNVCQVGG